MTTEGSVLLPTVRPGALTALLGELARAPERSGWTAPPVPGETIGRFEILREIGRGGFGVVYEARDTELGRSVAFKAVRAGSSDSVRAERALAEAEAAARLAHPNIVHLYDLGRCERGAFLIMELLRGESLEARLARGPLRLRDAVHVGVEISRGLAHAHEQGVLHRDLKPANVFFCDDGQVKVLDFGLAHVFGRGGASGGTPAYMAPEQARGEPSDERADVYALGVIVHELVTGKRPFEDGERGIPDGGKAPEMPGAPAALAKRVGRMLARDPAARPASGGEVHADLAAIRKTLEPRRLLWAAWAVSAAAVLAAIGFAVRSRPLPPGRLLVAIADAANTTGERDLDGVATLLGTALEQSRRFSVVARSRLVGLLRGPGGPTPDHIDEAAARRAARRADARALIVPAIRRTGDGYDVELRGIDLVRDEPLFTVREHAGGIRGVAEALDRLSERVRRELHEDPGDAPDRRVLLARVVPENPEALREYADGKRLDSEGLSSEASQAYERAVAADPRFPLAHAELAARSVFYDDETARRHFEAAMREADRLPPKERTLLEARRAMLLGRIEDAVAGWDRAIAGWPQDPTAYVQAGFALLAFYSDAAAARPYIEKAVALAALDNGSKIDALAELGRLDEALDVARRSVVESPGVQAFARLSYVHRLRGERGPALDAARRVVSFGWLPGSPLAGARHDPNAFWSLVDADAIDEVEELYRERGLCSWEVLALRGRLREAIRAYDDDARGGRLFGVPIEVAKAGDRAAFHNLRGTLAWGTGDAARVWREVAQQVLLGASAASCSAHLLASLGDLEHAARLSSIWAGIEDPRMHCPRLYRHVLKWKEGRGEDAAIGLAGMYGPAAAYHQGVVLASLGRDREAVEAFRRFRRDPGWNFDGENVIAYPRSLYLEAAALEHLGRRDEALQTVERLVRLWKHADPELQYVRAARALHSRLAARGRR